MDIVRFTDGLGNQMFQYAFMKSLEMKGRDVWVHFEHLSNPTYVTENLSKSIFPNVEWKEIIGNLIYKYTHNKKERQNGYALKNVNYWKERDEDSGIYEKDVYKTEECYFVGYFQAYQYVNSVSDMLIDDYVFAYGEDKLQFYVDKIKSDESYTSVHIRRGDYLNYPDFYGDICEKNYYNKAFDLIIKKFPNTKFLFFSDDVEWVLRNFGHYGNVIKKEIFNDYHDWYDMKLMSVCSNNIIANSSFSWWAAWLNHNKNKVVIAPRKWLRFCVTPDICPPEWIRL